MQFSFISCIFKYIETIKKTTMKTDNVTDTPVKTIAEKFNEIFNKLSNSIQSSDYSDSEYAQQIDVYKNAAYSLVADLYLTTIEEVKSIHMNQLLGI